MTNQIEPKHLAARDAFVEFLDVIERLRAPGGCPWDREQTNVSLKPYVIEEAYEVVDAIDRGGDGELCEELGDVLLQVGLHAQIAKERGGFDIAAVLHGINQKLIHRHPHVFGEGTARTAGEVVSKWEAIKKEEKPDQGLLDGLPRSMPALRRAQRMGEKVARVGFDWPDAIGPRKKITEELEELDEAVAQADEQAITHELGDVLFAIAQWARHLGIQSDDALGAGCRRFSERFGRLEKVVSHEGKKIEQMDIDDLETIWQRIKRSPRTDL